MGLPPAKAGRQALYLLLRQNDADTVSAESAARSGIVTKKRMKTPEGFFFYE